MNVLLAPEEINTMLGCINMSAGTPSEADCKRVCRATSRDHSSRDPLAVPLPDKDWQGSSHRTLRAIDRMEDIQSTRRFYNFGSLPWSECRVIGCMHPDPEFGKDEKYALIVRYAADGEMACYGVGFDGSVTCYWD